MVPDVAKKGHSFKGAFAYYLHDKKRDGEASRMTADRVQIVGFRNLATDDPETARRVMIATATQAAQLKQAAGKRAGAPGKAGPVYAYSLAWHADEAARINPAEMVRAADATLRELGAAHLQAVIVCHTDTAHPHVHIVVNRVDPATGILHGFQNDFRKLDAWALAYRKARGEEHLYCPARAQKAAERAGQTMQPARQREPANTNTKRPGMAFPMAATGLREKGADLARRSAAMKLRQKTEWRELSATYKATREAAYGSAAARRAASWEQLKADYRPHWRDLYRRQTAERKTFNRLGLVAAGITAWKASAPERGEALDRSWLRAAFTFLVSRNAREAALQRGQTREQRALGTTMKRAGDDAWRRIKADRGDELDAARRAFLARRAEIVARHDQETRANRQDWRDLAAEKDSFARRPTQAEHRGELERRHFQTAGEIRAAFAETLGSRQPRQERTRSRSRSRARTRDDGPKVGE